MGFAMTTIVRKRPFAMWLGLAALIIAFGCWLTQSLYFRQNGELLATALTLDLVVFLPGLYLVFARRFSLPRLAAIPIFFAAVFVASLLLPEAHQGTLDLFKYLIVPLELLAAGYLIFKTKSAVTAYKKTSAQQRDFVAHLTASLQETLGHNTAARILATEIAILYYAIFGWRVNPDSENSEILFSCHRQSAYGTFVYGFLFLIAIESVALHLLLMQWSATAAWILTALSGYGMLFLLADWNAIRQRSIVVGKQHLRLRIGLRWCADLNYAQIQNIELIKIRQKNHRDWLDLSLVRDANVVLLLHQPVELIGYYGMRKRACRIALRIDDAEKFIRHIHLT